MLVVLIRCWLLLARSSCMCSFFYIWYVLDHWSGYIVMMLTMIQNHRGIWTRRSVACILPVLGKTRAMVFAPCWWILFLSHLGLHVGLFQDFVKLSHQCHYAWCHHLSPPAQWHCTPKLWSYGAQVFLLETVSLMQFIMLCLASGILSRPNLLKGGLRCHMMAVLNHFKLILRLITICRQVIILIQAHL